MALFAGVLSLINTNSLSGPGNQVTQQGWGQHSSGSGTNNIVIQHDSGDNSAVHGNQNNVVEGSGGGQSSDVSGDGNKVNLQGPNDSVQIGSQGFLGLFGGQQSNGNQVTENGANNQGQVTGDNNQLNVQGNHNKANVGANNSYLGIHGDNNDVDLQSQNPENVSVYGDNLTVRQANGQIVATDSNGNEVPVNQDPKTGAYTVGTPPPPPQQTVQGRDCQPFTYPPGQKFCRYGV